MFPLLLQEVNGCWRLFLEEIVDLQLSPYKVDLQALLFHHLPPVPSFYEFTHERTVIASADPRLQSLVARRAHFLRLLHVTEVVVAPV